MNQNRGVAGLPFWDIIAVYMYMRHSEMVYVPNDYPDEVGNGYLGYTGNAHP